MTKTLKNLVESYQKGELNTPNIQVIDRIFSDEIINLPDGKLLNMTFEGGKGCCSAAFGTRRSQSAFWSGFRFARLSRTRILFMKKSAKHQGDPGQHEIRIQIHGSFEAFHIAQMTTQKCLISFISRRIDIG